MDAISRVIRGSYRVECAASIDRKVTAEQSYIYPEFSDLNLLARSRHSPPIPLLQIPNSYRSSFPLEIREETNFSFLDPDPSSKERQTKQRDNRVNSRQLRGDLIRRIVAFTNSTEKRERESLANSREEYQRDWGRTGEREREKETKIGDNSDTTDERATIFSKREKRRPLLFQESDEKKGKERERREFGAVAQAREGGDRSNDACPNAVYSHRRIPRR